jgi:acetylcholinesterase
MLSLILLFSLPLVQGLKSLKVDTTSGIVQGVVDTISPNVALFLGIPYAQQPIGSRRWLPSIPVVNKKSIDATRFGPACPQFEGNQNTTWLSDAPEFKIVPRDFMGEDCLSVNLWVPWKERKTPGDSARLLPVVAWIHGGSFQTGGASIPYQNPSRWVQRSRRHIVVGVK